MPGSPHADAAQAWARRYFGGVFLGDELVRCGHAVLAVDAIGWGSRSRPGLAAELDHPDVAALIAPRPLLRFGSPEDSLFPFDAVQAAARQLAPAWRAAPQHFEFAATPGGHRFDLAAQQRAWGWLQDPDARRQASLRL